MEILIITHGSFAEGIASALSIIVGEDEKVTTINAYLDEIPVADKINDYLATRDNVLVLTDMAGGSVNQAVMQHMNKKNLKIVAGINLPLVLELVLKNKNSDISETDIHEFIEGSKQQIVYVNDMISSDSSDDFD